MFQTLRQAQSQSSRLVVPGAAQPSRIVRLKSTSKNDRLPYPWLTRLFFGTIAGAHRCPIEEIVPLLIHMMEFVDVTIEPTPCHETISHMLTEFGLIGKALVLKRIHEDTEGDVSLVSATFDGTTKRADKYNNFAVSVRADKYNNFAAPTSTITASESPEYCCVFVRAVLMLYNDPTLLFTNQLMPAKIFDNCPKYSGHMAKINARMIFVQHIHI